MKNKFFSRCLFLFSIAALVVSLAGCYTLLKHPGLGDEERAASSYDVVPVSYADDCSSCHESPSYAAVHGYASPHRTSYDRWYYYYEYPWWVRYYEPSTGDGGAENGDQQQRPFGRRHRGSQEAEQPSQAAAAPSNPAPSPAVVAKSPGETPKSDPAPAPKDERRDERRGGDDNKESRRERKP